MSESSCEVVPWRLMLLPHERWIARRLMRRFARLDVRGRPATQMDLDHGRMGRVVFCVAMLHGVLAALVGLGAVVALIVTDGAPAVMDVIWACVIVEVYSFIRGCQAGLMRPNNRTASSNAET